MRKIIGIGNALVDVLIRLEDDGLLSRLLLPKGGMIIIDEEAQEHLNDVLGTIPRSMSTGGSACNAMLAVSGLGAESGYIGCIGADQTGRFFRDTCRTMGISAHLMEGPGHTGTANTFISPDGERTFATHLGAATSLGDSTITSGMFRGYGILHVEGYLISNHALIETICREAREAGLTISIDLGSYNIVEQEKDFFCYIIRKYIDIVFANEEEGKAISGSPDSAQALSYIAEMCSIAVVKLGSRGASAMDASRQRILVGAQKVDVVDTTAAGDFFAGGFLYALAHGAPLATCLAVGAHMSENVIQTIGTRLTPDTWQDIRMWVKDKLQ